MDKNLSELNLAKSIESSVDMEEFVDQQDRASVEEIESLPESVHDLSSRDEIVEIIDSSQRNEPLPQLATEMAKTEPIEPILPSSDLQTKIDALLSEREILAAEAVELIEQVDTQEALSNTLHQWVDEQKNSFLWKVLNTMSMNEKEVKSSLDGYQEFLGKSKIPKRGRLIEIRKRFHKSLLITSVVISTVSALVYYLPRLVENFPESSELSRFVNSGDYPTDWQILLIALSLVIFTLGSLLVQYYKDWSAFEREVTVTLWKLDEISNNVRHCRKEQARLSGLYPQVRDWLEIIGNALNTPWKIDEKWLASQFNEVPQDDFPFALRIAQAQENDSATSSALKRNAAERYLTRGWRTKAFEDQVLTAGELMGMSGDRLNVEVLDADIALSPGGPRAILKEKIKDVDLLKLVAKKQLLPLMRIVQIESIAESRPPVMENRTDVLDKFQPEDLDLELGQKIAWDDFLAISMGDSNKPRTPLSQLAFSEVGRQIGHHDRAKSIFITPNRLSPRIPNNESTFADSYKESTRLPLDIVVRMDIAGPLQQEDVLILDRSDEEIKVARSIYEQNIKDANLSNKSGV